MSPRGLPAAPPMADEEQPGPSSAPSPAPLPAPVPAPVPATPTGELIIVSLPIFIFYTGRNYEVSKPTATLQRIEFLVFVIS